MTHLAPEIRRLHRAGLSEQTIAAALRVPVSAVQEVTRPPVFVEHDELVRRMRQKEKPTHV